MWTTFAYLGPSALSSGRSFEGHTQRWIHFSGLRELQATRHLSPMELNGKTGSSAPATIRVLIASRFLETYWKNSWIFRQATLEGIANGCLIESELWTSLRNMASGTTGAVVYYQM